MAVKQTGRFTSEAQYLKELAKSSDLFNQNTYADMVAQGRGAEYSAAIYGTKDKSSVSFNWSDYNLLSGQDQYAYLVNEYYVDRNETAIDEKTGARYNIYERNKEYLDYQIDEQIKENIYNSLNGWEKLIYSVGGFIGDVVSTVYSIGEGVIDAVLFLSEGTARLFGDEQSAETLREWASYDTTGARTFQSEIDDFIKTYTIWDKNNVTSTIREIGQSIAKMAPLALNIIAPGVGSAIYYTSMAGDLYHNTIQSNPDIDYGNLFLYVAGSTALEAAIEIGSAKLFGNVTSIDKMFGLKGASAGASFFKRMGMDMFTEGLEEATAEVFGTLLEKATINPNAQLTLENVWHAALVGGLVGGIMTGGSILGTKNMVIDKTTGKPMVDADGNNVTWNQLSKEQRKNAQKVGKLNTLAYKEFLMNYADSTAQISEVTKLKNKYNQSVEELKSQHADEYAEATNKDIEAGKKQALTALKFSKLLETIGVDGFTKAVNTLQQANDDAIRMIDNYLNKVTGTTEKIRNIQSAFEQAHPGVNISIKENLTTEEKRIQNAIKDAYGVDVYFGDFGTINGVDTSNFKRVTNSIFIDSNMVANMSYENLFKTLIKKELVNTMLVENIVNQNDFRKLAETILPEGTDVTNVDEIKETMAQMLLFDEVTVSKVFDTNKNLFGKIAKWVKSLTKKNRMAKKDEANKVEFNQLLKIRQKYVDAVAKAIGNESDVEQAKVVMELSDDEVQHIKDKYQTDATNEHIILMKTNFTQNASEKRDVERFLIDNRLGDKRLKLDYSQIYNTEYYKETFVQEVLDTYPGKLFKDALWYYVSDKYGYAISQTNNTIYKQVDLISQSNPKFINTLTQAIENKDTTSLTKYAKIQNILKPEFLKAFDTTDLNRITIQYENVLSVNGRTVINPDGTITIQVNTDANHITQLQYELYHEISHALGYIQGFSYGTSYMTMVSTLNAEKPSVVKNLAAKILEPEFVISATQSELVDALAYQLYLMSEGERYASGKKESFAKDTDGFVVTETEIQGVGKFASFKTTLSKPNVTSELKEVKTSNAGARFIEETGISDLKAEGFSDALIEAYEKKILNQNMLWQLISHDKVGTTEATNKLISWLKPENKHMKTIQDVDNAIANGIAYAVTYYGYRWSNELKRITKPDFDVRTDVSYETLKDEFSKKDSPYLPIYEGVVKYTKDGRIGRVHGIFDRIYNLLDKPGNKYAIYKWLLSNDFDYSDKQTGELLRRLQDKGGINKDAEKEFVEATSIEAEKESDTISSVDAQQFNEWAQNMIDDDSTESIEKTLIEIVKNKDIDSVVSALTETSKKLENSHRAFDLRAHIESYTSKALLEKMFGEESWEKILKVLPPREQAERTKVTSRQNKLKQQKQLTDVESRLVSVDTTGFSPNDYKQLISYLDGEQIPNPDEYFKNVEEINKNFKQEKQQKQTEEPKISDQEKYAGEVKRGKVVDGKFMTTEEIERSEIAKAGKEEALSLIKNEDGSYKELYHGAKIGGITKFDSTISPKGKTIPDVTWLTDSRVMASSYVPKTSPDSTIYTVEAHITNPLLVDAKGESSWNAIDSVYGRLNTDQIVRKAKEDGYDAVVFKDLKDYGGHPGYKTSTEPGTVVAVIGSEKAQIINEDKNVLGKRVVEKKEISPKTTQEVSEVETPSETINVKKPNTIAQAILDNFKEATQGVSEAQFFDDTDMTYQKVGKDMLDKNANLFVVVTNENYDDVRNTIKSDTSFYADQALVVFDLYTLEMKGKFSKEIQDKIEAFNRRELTKSAQKLALQAQRVAERKPITNYLKQFTREGYAPKITDEQLQEYNKKLQDKDAYIKELSDKIASLEEQIKSTQNELERAALSQEAKEVSEQKLVLEHGSNEDIADWIVTHAETWETATKIQDDILNKAIDAAERAEAENKNIGYFFYNKDGTPKPFPKTREVVAKTLKKLKSFRMWAMLSSPVTWVRNWVGNKGMQALDGATNAVERFISKRVGFDATQMKFNETRAGKEVYNHIAESNKSFIKSLIRGEGTKYDPSGEQAANLSRQVRAKEYESANAFRKLCLKAQDATDWGLATGFLGDEPVVFSSICKNLGNLVASNTDFLLKGIQSELDKLNLKSTLSEDQQKRKTLLETAIQTKKATDIFDAMSKEETERLFDQAKTMSFQQYFKNQNAFSKWMQNLGTKNPVMAEVVSWIMPFPKVAMNVLTMAYRYSPLGFISGVMQWSQARQVTTEGYKGPTTGFEQAKMVRTFSEATVGTFMLIAGAIAAALGWVDVDEDDYLGPCLHFGDVRISLSELAPSMTTFSTAAAMTWAYKNEKSIVSEALNVLYDNTLLGNVENLFRYSSLETFGQNLSISYISQYIPAVVKWVNKSLLQTPTKDKSGPYFTKLLKTLASYVPGLATLVPNKIDPYTGKAVYASGSSNWFLNFIATSSPLDIEFDNTSGIAAEAERLGVKTTGLDGDFVINGKNVSASNKNKETLAKFRANYIQSEYEKIINGKKLVTVEDEDGKRITTTYNKLTDKQKSNVLKNLYTKATTASKIEYWTSLGNKYIVTNQDDLKYYKSIITNKSNIIYKQSWSKSKFVEG